MTTWKSRVLTLALAGLMAGQAILPVSAAENTDPAQSTENAEAGIMLIDEVGTDDGDAGETSETTAENTAEAAGAMDDAAASEDAGTGETTASDADTAEADKAATPDAGRTVAPDTGEMDAENAETDTTDATTTETVADDAVEDLVEVEENDDTEELATLETIEATDAVADDTEESGSLSGGIKGSTGGVIFTGGKTGTHKTIDTVDSTSLGVKMYMYQFPSSDDYYSDHFYDTCDDGASRIFSDNGSEILDDMGLVKPLLGDDGYPILTSTGESLGTWFDTDADEYAATQANHLFSQAVYDETGYLSFDCTDNYAYFNQSSGNFKVYEDVGVPWWGYAVEEDGTLRLNKSGNEILSIAMRHGQFFPYDDLTDYVEPNFRQTTNIWGGELNEDDPQYGRALYRSTGYTFHFGMYIDTNFIQPIDGVVTSNGSAENMRYEFSGDDDLWVFIDDVLVLDIGGIHGARSGYIDFATGEVYQAAADQKTTIRTLFEDAGVADKVEWNGDTFADYSEHSFKMFYMERGENCGGLQVRMNLITIPENHASKQVYDASGKKIDGQTVDTGDELTYKITAENPASVTKDVVVTDILPDGVAFISADNGGTCTDGKVTWTLSMAAGAQQTVTFKVRIKDEAVGTTINNEAIEEIGKIALKTNEVTNPVNNRYQIMTDVENGTITDPVDNIRKGTDQQITYSPDKGYILDSITVDGETVDPEQYEDDYTFQNIDTDHTIKVVYAKIEGPVKAVMDVNSNNMIGQYVTDGEEITYTITVKNPSGMNHDITVTDTIPDALKIKTVSDNGKIDGQKITWMLKDVAAYSSRTVSITAAAIGTDKEQTVDNTAQMTIGGHTLTSNNVRILIPVKPKVTTKETTVTNKTVNNETENNVVENNKTITNETKNNTDTNQIQPTETTQAADTAATTANGATITGYRNVNTGDMSLAGLLLAIAGAAAVGLGIYYYKRRH